MGVFTNTCRHDTFGKKYHKSIRLKAIGSKKQKSFVCCQYNDSCLGGMRYFVCLMIIGRLLSVLVFLNVATVICNVRCIEVGLCCIAVAIIGKQA